MAFICPVCHNVIENLENEKIYRCKNNHCFDAAKQGYVNLLQSQQSKNKRHGDDKLMIKARTEFLNKGYYGPLADKICELLSKHLNNNSVVLDAGCGDCYYTDKFEKKLREINAKFFGIDISKDALIAGGKRNKNIKTAVASVFDIPFENSSCNAVLNIFSPFALEEYIRIIVKNGILLRVIPLEDHLFNLKKAVYDKPIKNPKENLDVLGFEIVENVDLKYTIEIDNNLDIQNLFKMTPYFYKTSKSDQKKLENITSLITQAEFKIIIYKKL